MSEFEPEYSVRVCIRNKRNQLWTIRRAGKWRVGELELPGGKPEPQDKSLLHTGLREAQEELGLDIELNPELASWFLRQGPRLNSRGQWKVTDYYEYREPIEEGQIDLSKNNSHDLAVPIDRPAGIPFVGSDPLAVNGVGYDRGKASWLGAFSLSHLIDHDVQDRAIVYYAAHRWAPLIDLVQLEAVEQPLRACGIS